MLEAQLLAQLPDDKRDYFQTIMSLAQKSGNFSEEHNQYFDLYAHAMVRRVCLGVGTLVRQERHVRRGRGRLLPRTRTKCAAPASTADMHDYRKLIARRRAEYAEWCETDNPPILGDMTHGRGHGRADPVERLDHAQGGRGLLPGAEARAQGRPLRRLGLARRVRGRRSSRHERARPQRPASRARSWSRRRPTPAGRRCSA